jgi:hypothetical protein
MKEKNITAQVQKRSHEENRETNGYKGRTDYDEEFFTLFTNVILLPGSFDVLRKKKRSCFPLRLGGFARECF